MYSHGLVTDFHLAQSSCRASILVCLPVPPTLHFLSKLNTFARFPRVTSSWLSPHFVPNSPLLFRPVPSSLCSLSSSQFNHFSHFKIPQFYRSSRLSLPVSTAALLATHPVASLLTFELPDLTPTHLIASEAPLPTCIRRAVFKPLRRQSLSFSPHRETVGSAANVKFSARVLGQHV